MANVIISGKFNLLYGRCGASSKGSQWAARESGAIKYERSWQ